MDNQQRFRDELSEYRRVVLVEAEPEPSDLNDDWLPMCSECGDTDGWFSFRSGSVLCSNCRYHWTACASCGDEYGLLSPVTGPWLCELCTVSAVS